MLRKIFRCVYYLMYCLLLVSCVTSPKMSQELEQGKMNFIAGNYKQAFHELLPIAAKGSAQAEYAVGYMYYYGYGVSQDNDSGIFWMQKAAAQNFEPAVKALEMIHHKSMAKRNTDEGYLDLTLNSVHAPIQLSSQQDDEEVQNDDDEVMTSMMDKDKQITPPPVHQIKPALLAPVRQTKTPHIKAKIVKTIKPQIKKSITYVKKSSPTNHVIAKASPPHKINLRRSTCYWGVKIKLRDKFKMTHVRYVVKPKKPREVSQPVLADSQR